MSEILTCDYVKDVYYENVRYMTRLILGLLTGRPKEEAILFGRNLLKELSIVHEQARKVMKSKVKAL